MLPSTSPRKTLFACPPSLPWNMPSFTVESTLFFPRSRYDAFFFPQVVALAHLDSLPPHNLVVWTSCSVPFLFGKGGSGVLANCSFGALWPLFLVWQAQYADVFSAEVCAILQALFWSRKHQQIGHFLLLFSNFCSFLATLSFPPSFLSPRSLWQIWQEVPSLPSCTIRLQWTPERPFLPGNGAVALQCCYDYFTIALFPRLLNILPL